MQQKAFGSGVISFLYNYSVWDSFLFIFNNSSICIIELGVKKAKQVSQ